MTQHQWSQNNISSSSPYYTHSPELSLVPVKYRINSKILLLTYKALNNLSPSILCNLLHPHEPSRTLRSSSCVLLSVPCSHLPSFGDRGFSKIALLWNSFPLTIRQFLSLFLFKSRLKTHLCSQASICLKLGPFWLCLLFSVFLNSLLLISICV